MSDVEIMEIKEDNLQYAYGPMFRADSDAILAMMAPSKKQKKPSSPPVSKPSIPSPASPVNNSFPIQAGWDVRITVFEGTDDEAIVLYNGTLVIHSLLGDPTRTVSLKNVLRTGTNEVQVLGVQLDQTKWQIHYAIWIFDTTGAPLFPVCDILQRGWTPHEGVQWNETYEFPRS